MYPTCLSPSEATQAGNFRYPTPFYFGKKAKIKYKWTLWEPLGGSQEPKIYFGAPEGFQKVNRMFGHEENLWLFVNHFWGRVYTRHA
jgi:hypothetical protein